VVETIRKSSNGLFNMEAQKHCCAECQPLQQTKSDQTNLFVYHRISQATVQLNSQRHERGFLIREFDMVRWIIRGNSDC
jgi:hypothetical protein